MIYLRQATASQEVPLGYFVDATDEDTAETALTIANTDIKVWKTGATTLASKTSGGATHISGGIYYCVLDATDTDTAGPLKLFVHVAGARAVTLECCVLPANVYDSFVAGSSQVTEATIAAEVVIEMDANSTKLADTLAAVNASGDVTVDGTITRDYALKLLLAYIGGTATGMRAGDTTKVLKDQSGATIASATYSAGGTRTVVLTP